MQRGHIFPVLLCFVMLALLLAFPAEALQAAGDGLRICYASILPALLPFIFLTGMLQNTPAFTLLGSLLRPVMRGIFRQSCECGAVWALSALSGYPSGAKLTGDLVRNKTITPAQGEAQLALCNTCGPGFMLSAVGAGMLDSPAAGMAILAAHFLGAFMSGFVFSRRLPKPSRERITAEARTYPPFTDTIGTQAANAMAVLLKICALVVLCFVLIELLNRAGVTALLVNGLSIIMKPFGLEEFAKPVMSAVLEMTQGAAQGAAVQASLQARTVFCCIGLSFGGLCILAQAAACLNGCGIRMRIVLLQKLCHACISGVICYFIAPLFLREASDEAFAAASVPGFAVTLLPVVGIVVIAIIFCLFGVRRAARNRWFRASGRE